MCSTVFISPSGGMLFQVRKVQRPDLRAFFCPNLFTDVMIAKITIES